MMYSKLPYSSLLLAVWLIGSTVSANADSKPTQLGSSWVGKDGLIRHPKIEVVVPKAGQPSSLDAKVFRLPQLDQAASTIAIGHYPSKLAKQDEAAVSFAGVTIDETGLITYCRAGSGGTYSEIADAFTCPHLIANARFFPALSIDGKRVRYDTSVYVYYTMFDYQTLRWNAGYILPPKPFAARTLDNGDVEKSLNKLALKGKDIVIQYNLDVEQNGGVTACDLVTPTFNDKFDFEICSTLMEHSKFKPHDIKYGARYQGMHRFE